MGQEIHAATDQGKQERPLVTFLVLAYNQERFIREAVEGAFAQAYEPLEIILSDDCSTDRTFEIIKEMAGKYTGPAYVVVNRNPRNLGIAEHMNTVFRMAKGDLIICSAGDDVSLPERSSRIVEEWLSHGKPDFLWSNFYLIDGLGNIIRKSTVSPEASDALFAKPLLERLRILLGLRKNSLREPPIVGCSTAYSRRLFADFEPLSDGVYEDSAMFFRSLLTGRYASIVAPLVKYRAHESNMSFTLRPKEVTIAWLEKAEAFRDRRFLMFSRLLRGQMNDLRTFLRMSFPRSCDRRGFAPVLRRMEYWSRILEAQSKWSSICLPRRLVLFASVLMSRDLRTAIWMFGRILPRRVRSAIRYAMIRVRLFEPGFDGRVRLKR